MLMKSFLFAIAFSCAPVFAASPAAAEDVRELAPGVWRIAGENAASSPANGGVIVTTLRMPTVNAKTR